MTRDPTLLLPRCCPVCGEPCPNCEPHCSEACAQEAQETLERETQGATTQDDLDAAA